MEQTHVKVVVFVKVDQSKADVNIGVGVGDVLSNVRSDVGNRIKINRGVDVEVELSIRCEDTAGGADGDANLKAVKDECT